MTSKLHVPSGAALLKRVPTHVWLGAIVAVGLALRLAWVLHVQPAPFGDSQWYANVASNVLHGHGFVANHNNPVLEPPDVPQPTAFYPPLYPLTLAALWKAFGTSVMLAQVFNAVVGALTIPLVFVLGSNIFGRRVGLAAAATFAVLPNSIAWLPFLLSETLFTFIFMAALCVLVSFCGVEKRTRAVLAFGVLAGLAMLTRGEGIVLLPAASLFWLARDGWRAALQHCIVAAIAVAIVMTPWTARNWIELGSPIPVSSSSGMNLRIGHSPQSNGTWLLLNDPVEGIDGWRSLDRPETEVRGDKVYTKRALSWAVTHPRQELYLARQKVRYLYQSEDDMALGFVPYGGSGVTPAAVEHALRPLIASCWYVSLAAAILLAPAWLSASPKRLLLMGVLVFWTAFHVAFFGLPRFHLPLLPLIIIAASGGVASVLADLRQSLRKPSLAVARPNAG
jgi:4-amino-4-deoxy-L-arabinose transferase-like glycosyltransferase